MKRILWYILAIVVAVASCTSGKVSPRLVAIDSLIATAPDSACALLAAFPADSLAYGDNRPYHALLTTIADYKAYRPATSDSAISIALEHYDRSGADPDKRMRSLLYRGCVATELGNDTLAMRYYKLAQQRCPASDLYHQGYIHFRIAQLYRKCIENKRAVAHLKKAHGIFERIGNRHYLMETSRVLGEAYTVYNGDSAFYYINKGIRMAQEANDSSYLNVGRYNLSNYYYMCHKDYRTAADILKQLIDESLSSIDPESAYYFACLSLVNLGKTDSAKIYFGMMHSPQTPLDSLRYLECEGKIKKLEGDYNGGDEQVNKSYAIGDSITHNNLGGIMAQTELNAEAEAQRQKIQHRQLLFLLALGLVAAIATVIFVKARKIRVIARKRDEEITRLNKQIDIALAKLQQERQDPQLPLQPVTTTPAYDSLEQGFKCYRDIIMELTTVHGSKHVKHNNLAKVLTPEFFGRLRQYVNARHDNLITKLANGPYKLSEQDINIICLELCHFPNAVLWAYLDTNDIHAVYNRKTYIIKKIGIVKKIDELPTYFANTPATSV